MGEKKYTELEQWFKGYHIHIQYTHTHTHTQATTTYKTEQGVGA